MNAIQKYFKYRQSLIDQYAKGDMTKREYLQKNYEAVVYGDIGPLLLQQEGQSNADSTAYAGFPRRCGVFREGAKQVSEGKAV